MPTYTITDPNTGRKVKLTGDSEPTEQELNDIFSSPEMVKEEPAQKMEEAKPFLGSQTLGNIGMTMDAAGASVRSALQGKGYAEGAINPSKVRKFQDIASEQFYKNVPLTTSPAINTILGMPASAVGLAADIVTNPADVLMGIAPALKPIQALGKSIAGTKAAQTVGSAATAKITPFKWVKDAFGGIKKAQASALESEKNVLKEVADKVGVIKSKGSRMKEISSSLSRKYKESADAEVDSIAKALEYAEQSYSGKIADTSFTKSAEIRKELPKLFKAKSEEYGIGRNKILSENPATATKSEVIPSIEESLLNHGILGTDDSGKIMVRRSAASKGEKSILDEYLRLRQLPDDAVINASELVTSQDLIRPKFGKTWTPSDHLQAEVSEGISDILSVKIPKLAEYRKNYAPFLEWKKEAIKQFQPFAGKFANKKGTQILSKYADVDKTLTKDEASVMSILEQQSGKDFTSQLKGIRGLGREIEGRKSGMKSIKDVKGQEVKDIAENKKSQIDDLIASRVRSLENQGAIDISKIKQETSDIVDALKRRRLIIGGIAGVVAYKSFMKYVGNRLTYNLFGITGN